MSALQSFGLYDVMTQLNNEPLDGESMLQLSYRPLDGES